MAAPKKFVYVLKSVHAPVRYYTGLTSDVSRRLCEHNDGRCPSTVLGRPWHIDLVVEFPDECRAAAFERYLKSGSGGAFAVRHLR
jgi:putative endonuclease